MDNTVCLIAGLGNPGSEYDGTRHNVGFAFIERFLAKLPGQAEKVHAFNSFYWKVMYAGRKLLLQMPQTYMNLSGNAVAGLAAAEKILPEQVMIVHDDMDLTPGRIRLRTNGSSGGHNGIGSVIEKLGTQKFSRLRIGIGKMANGHGSADFVLSKFTDSEQELMNLVLDMAADAVILTLRRGMNFAMAQFNNRDLAMPEEPEKEQEKHTEK